jgi:hypothetical protein
MTAAPRRWLQRDTGHARVQRGSPRSVVGLTIVICGLLLVVSVSLDWVHIAVGRGPNTIVQASVSGAGTVSVVIPQDDPEFERYAAESLGHVVSHTGVWVAAIGVLIVVAGATYLWLRPRTEAAIAVTVLAAIGSGFCLSYAFNVKRTFTEVLDLSSAHYSLAFGLVAACVLTVLLTALGVAAFVLERSVIQATAKNGDDNHPRPMHEKTSGG